MTENDEMMEYVRGLLRKQLDFATVQALKIEADANHIVGENMACFDELDYRLEVADKAIEADDYDTALRALMDAFLIGGRVSAEMNHICYAKECMAITGIKNPE